MRINRRKFILSEGKKFYLVGEGDEPGDYNSVLQNVKDLGMRMPSLDELVKLFFDMNGTFLPDENSLLAGYPIFSRERAIVRGDSLEVALEPGGNSLVVPFDCSIKYTDENDGHSANKKLIGLNKFLQGVFQKQTLDKIQSYCISKGINLNIWFLGTVSCIPFSECTEGYGFFSTPIEMNMRDENVYNVDLGFDKFEYPVMNNGYGYTFAT